MPKQPTTPRVDPRGRLFPLPPIGIYVGGPLHGQVARRRGHRWSSYRDERGETVKTRRGDRARWQVQWRPKRPRPIYIAEVAGVSGTTRAGRVYVHSYVRDLDWQPTADALLRRAWGLEGVRT